jgi:hypothetical protein
VCKGAQIIAMFVQLGGEDTVKRIVQLIGHEDSKVQIAAVEFLVVIASGLFRNARKKNCEWRREKNHKQIKYEVDSVNKT